VLALVALFTGAFLVFSTQALSVMRRRSQFALLRVLGVARPAAAPGPGRRRQPGRARRAAGHRRRLRAGRAALRFFGGDLGAGYFPGVKPQVVFTPVAASCSSALGLGVALLGCLAPALEAARAKPAVALKAGNDEAALSRLSRVWPSLVCLALARPVRLRAARVRAAAVRLFRRSPCC
jgi:putative ABC transport system permease protein